MPGSGSTTTAASTVRPFLSLAPRALSPLVLTCEHASRRLPFRARLRPDEREVLASHWGWDIGGWALTRELARRLGAGAVGGRWSRLVIDLNRRPDDPSLIRRQAGPTTLSWNDDLCAAEVERRVLDYYAPYHAEVDRQILRRVVRGAHPLLFAVHTFTPVLDGRERRFQIGVLYNDHRDRAHRLGRVLREAGLSVRYNQPYSGLAGMMYSVERHGTCHRLPCLELEVNHDLLRTARQARRLGAAIAPALAELSGRAASG